MVLEVCQVEPAERDAFQAVLQAFARERLLDGALQEDVFEDSAQSAASSRCSWCRPATSTCASTRAFHDSRLPAALT